MAGNTSNTNFTYTHYIYAYMCETTDDIHTLARRIKKISVFVFLCYKSQKTARESHLLRNTNFFRCVTSVTEQGGSG